MIGQSVKNNLVCLILPKYFHLGIFMTYFHFKIALFLTQERIIFE